MPYGRRTRRTRRTRSTARRQTRRYSRKGTAVAYRALRVARSATRRVAGEACKFELTPLDFYTTTYTVSGNNRSVTSTYTLNTITSGTPWIMPLNWYYTGINSVADNWTKSNNNNSSGSSQTNPLQGNAPGGINVTPGLSSGQSYQLKIPAFYKMITGDITPDSGTELQYRMKYLYINAIFNSSTPGRMRFVIVRDKLPTDQGLTWFNATDSKRSVFNANNINAQLNPLSNGRFTIMYDKTMQINTINPLKPFKYYRKISNKVRNATPVTPKQGYEYTVDAAPSVTTSPLNSYIANYNYYSQPQSQTSPTPIGRNAFYLMIFSDGCSFNYDNSDGATEENTFKLMSRVSYYNN